MGKLLGLGACLLYGLLAGGVAQAQSMGEVRGGILLHSVDGAVWDFTRIQDANVELLFNLPSLDEWVSIGRVRPHIGATINTGGLESMAYAGLSWTVPVFETPIFVEAAFGGAIHNGALAGAVAPARDLGCTVLFHESASIGWQLTPATSVMATVEHASHAGLCGAANRGLTNLGIRFGMAF